MVVAMQKRVFLIIGGYGFIGRKFVKHLLAHEHADDLSVFVVDNLFSASHNNIEFEPIDNKNVISIIDDARNLQRYCDQLENVDTVVYLAADTGTSLSVSDFSGHIDRNLTPLIHTLDVCRNLKNISNFIFFSSRAVYGEGPYIDIQNKTNNVIFPKMRAVGDFKSKNWDFAGLMPHPAVEDIATSPSSPYGYSKKSSENIIQFFRERYLPDLRATIFRPQNIYGAGQNIFNSYSGVLGKFYKLFVHNHTVPIYEDGLMLRDWIYIDDVIKVLFEATSNRTHPGQQSFEIYNLGTGQSHTILEVAVLMKKLLSSSSDITCTSEARIGDIRHAICNNEKLMVDFNLTEFTGLNDGLEQFLIHNHSQHYEDVKNISDVTDDEERTMTEKSNILISPED